CSATLGALALLGNSRRKVGSRQRCVNNCLPPPRALFITDPSMLWKAVISTLVCGIVGTTYAQQVEVPREPGAKSRRASAQPVVEVRPQTVAYTETSAVPMPRLSVEQMRQAGAVAARKVQEENHDIETDSNEPAPPPPKKQIAANAVRPI